MLHPPVEIYVYKKSLETKYKSTKFGKSELNSIPLNSSATQSFGYLFSSLCFLQMMIYMMKSKRKIHNSMKKLELFFLYI